MTCHGIMCKNKCHPCFCGWKAFKQDEKYHWVVSEDNVLGIHGRFMSPLRTTLTWDKEDYGKPMACSK